ncbi:hypothetical protein QBD00_004101 [Ochrobactrum sp. AN78]|nr:hypothetical protein [Ochrobactrum sp. AN78]
MQLEPPLEVEGAAPTVMFVEAYTDFMSAT